MDNAKADLLPESLRESIARSAKDGILNIAFSGGLDSRFLAWAAKLMGLETRLLHAVGPHMARFDTESAERHAAECGGIFVKVPFDPLQFDLASAGRQRCYVCKKAIFTALLAKCAGGVLCDGTNASDKTVFRPGAKALVELGIASPLAEAGMTKDDIRKVAAATGMTEPMQPARPCMLTRFPYGMPIKASLLGKVAAAEKDVEAVLGKKANFRIRFPAGENAELHVLQQEFEQEDERLSKAQAVLSEKWFQEGARVVMLDTMSGYFDRK